MELERVLRLRQSVRDYQKKQIDEKQLRYILGAGMAAPVSRKDYKSIKITVVQEKSLLEELRIAFGDKADPFYGAQTVIIVSTTQAAVKNIEQFNVACIIENMLLAATDLGLGSIYLTAFLRSITDNQMILKKLEIPNGYEPISAIAVGYKTYETPELTYEEIAGRIEVIRK